MTKLDQPCTQAEFGALVGIAQQTVSEMVGEGILQSGAPLGHWLLAYCARLREQAAGRLGSGPDGLDLAQERAALAREQRRGLEIKNGVLRAEYAPVSLLGEVLASASQAVAEGFDHLPGQIRKACPNLPPAATDQVMSVIAGARNKWVKGTVELLAAKLITTDDDDDLQVAAGDEEPPTT